MFFNRKFNAANNPASALNPSSLPNPTFAMSPGGVQDPIASPSLEATQARATSQSLEVAQDSAASQSLGIVQGSAASQAPAESEGGILDNLKEIPAVIKEKAAALQENLEKFTEQSTEEQRVTVQDRLTKVGQKYQNFTESLQENIVKTLPLTGPGQLLSAIPEKLAKEREEEERKKAARQGKMALVLEGGGAKGSYQAGAYRALKEAGFHFDYVVGTSIGSINGAMIAQGDDELMDEIWLTSNMSRIVGDDIDQEEVEKLLDGGLSLANLSKGADLIRQIFSKKGLDITPLKELFATYIDEDKLRASSSKLGVCTVNLSKRQPVQIFIDEMPPGTARDYVLASSYLPIFKMEPLGGDIYVDGAAYENVPTSMVEDLAEKIVVIGLFPDRLRYQPYLKDARYLFIHPEKDLPEMIRFSPEVAKENIRLGYEDMKRQLAAQHDSKIMFWPGKTLPEASSPAALVAGAPSLPTSEEAASVENATKDEASPGAEPQPSAIEALGDRFARQMSFILKLDEEKNVFRQTHLTNHGRRENDAEHAWHMAVMAYILQEYSKEPVDLLRVILLCLTHDLVEIEAGDTYAYDKEGLATQKEREEKAKEDLFSMLPDDQAQMFKGLFEEFEAQETPEAKFARAMDNFQPLLLNHSNDGGDWVSHQVHASDVYRRQSQTKPGSPTLYAVTDEILQEHIAKGHLIQEDSKGPEGLEEPKEEE